MAEALIPGDPDKFIPIVLNEQQAMAAFAAVRTVFGLAPARSPQAAPLAQAMLKIAQAIDAKAGP